METSALAPAPVRVVSAAIGDYLARLGTIWIEGEIAEINHRGQGLAFLRLKDSSADLSISVTARKSVLDAAGPLAANARIVINARVTWFAKRGDLSFEALDVRQVGLGELLARLEQLKQTLAAEGLFALDRKNALPFLPRKVGLICGRASAAMRDVHENARRRWPAVEFETREVAVQGVNAVIEVKAALLELDALDDVDVIIITRGGGSFEDLLPFSDEGLVRAVASARTPVVSAIGHEQDQPLLDLVADFRASTPTDAAKRVVPDVVEELRLIATYRDRIRRVVSHGIERDEDRLRSIRERSHRAMTTLFNRIQESLHHATVHLRALSPQSTLDRGYAIVLKENHVVLSTEQVLPHDQLRVRVSDGHFAAKVISQREETP
jgi:exodeoxyribonuclease VII large subunit